MHSYPLYQRERLALNWHPDCSSTCSVAGLQGGAGAQAPFLPNIATMLYFGEYSHTSTLLPTQYFHQERTPSDVQIAALQVFRKCSSAERAPFLLNIATMLQDPSCIHACFGALVVPCMYGCRGIPSSSNGVFYRVFGYRASSSSPENTEAAPPENIGRMPTLLGTHAQSQSHA